MKKLMVLILGWFAFEESRGLTFCMSNVSLPLRSALPPTMSSVALEARGLPVAIVKDVDFDTLAH